MLWGSRALTEMREQITSTVGARVILGGRLSGQQGLYPGVAEEAVMALRAGVPLFVAGGFGGCGRAIASAIMGDLPSELTIEHQLQQTPRFAQLLEAARAAGEVPSYEGLSQAFSDAGVAGLRNGLGEVENQRLFVTDDVDEVVALILRGLRTITEK